MAVGPPGSFSYRRAIESACFVQCPLMPMQAFIAQARQRGEPFLDQAALEGLDREELMPPVGFIVGEPFMPLGDRSGPIRQERTSGTSGVLPILAI